MVYWQFQFKTQAVFTLNIPVSVCLLCISHKYHTKSILFHDFTNTQTEDNISATQYKLQYNTGVAIQDNAAQYWLYSIILAAKQTQILVNLPKWYI